MKTETFEFWLWWSQNWYEIYFFVFYWTLIFPGLDFYKFISFDLSYILLDICAPVDCQMIPGLTILENSLINITTSAPTAPSRSQVLNIPMVLTVGKFIICFLSENFKAGFISKHVFSSFTQYAARRVGSFLL